MKHITLFLSLGCLLPSALAIPHPFARRSAQCNANDGEIYTRENWQAKNVDLWFSTWHITTAIKSAESGVHFNLDEALAEQYGLGQTFDCTINNECERPRCSELVGKEDHLELVSMILTSMSNFNKYCVRLANALDGAQVNYATMQVALQQTFYPAMVPANFKGLQGLNAFTAIVGIATAWLGPVSKPLQMAGANTFKEVFGSVARGVSATMTASDKSLELLAEMGTEVKNLFNSTLTNLELEHNSLMAYGSSDATGGSLSGMFTGGIWVDYKKISVLNSDVLEAQVKSYYSNMIFAMMINKGWQEQGAYIISKKMTQADCDALDTKDIVKICANGRGYWLASHQKGVKLASPAGASKLNETIQITAQDAMMSSIDAFNTGGYKYDPSTLLDQELLNIDPTANWQAGPRLRGVFNIPVCEFETTSRGNDFLDGDWGRWILEIGDSVTDLNGLGACVCGSAKDRQGVPISEIESYGPGSFKDLTAGQTEDCEEWEFESDISF